MKIMFLIYYNYERCSRTSISSTRSIRLDFRFQLLVQLIFGAELAVSTTAMPGPRRQILTERNAETRVVDLKFGRQKYDFFFFCQFVSLRCPMFKKIYSFSRKMSVDCRRNTFILSYNALLQ